MEPTTQTSVVRPGLRSTISGLRPCDPHAHRTCTVVSLPPKQEIMENPAISGNIVPRAIYSHGPPTGNGLEVDRISPLVKELRIMDIRLSTDRPAELPLLYFSNISLVGHSVFGLAFFIREPGNPSAGHRPQTIVFVPESDRCRLDREIIRIIFAIQEHEGF